MRYFAYGSNMSLARLRHRVPAARALGRYQLVGHELRFHKVGQDGSAKCDAHETRDHDDVLFGVLFDINEADKRLLDRIEGLGRGYVDKEVTVMGANGIIVVATTYCATHIDTTLVPYTWYKTHVLTGAGEAGLPVEYIRRIEAVAALADPDPERGRRELAIYR